MNENISDKRLLDYLQWLNDRAKYTGRCTLRESTTGRGWRLHESSIGKASVREVILGAMLADEEYQKHRVSAEDEK